MNARINGKSCDFQPGEYLIDVAGRSGFGIPTLCHHDGLRGHGGCRVCLVEMDGNVVPACVTRLTNDCEITTDSKKIIELRSVIIALLQKRAPLSDEIAALARQYNAPALSDLKIIDDNDRCVLCGLCVRACRSLGAGAISAMNRGITKKIATPYEEEPESCIGCGSCAEVCPTGAIPVEQTADTRKIWGRVFAMKKCSDCGEPFTTHEAAVYSADKVGQKNINRCLRCRNIHTCATIYQTFGRK